MIKITRIALIFFFALVVMQTSSHGSEEVRNQRSTYKIPKGFHPEPISIVSRMLFSNEINSSEFSFRIDSQYLQRNVEGFDASLYGMDNTLRVTVNTFDPEIHSSWEPSERQIERWNNLWSFQGDYQHACMGERKDEVTKLYRLYLLCDSNLNSAENSNFYLVDEIPAKDKKRPEDNSYIKATCRLINRPASFQIKEQFLRCIISRKTPWKDRVRFVLYGNNNKWMEEVSTFVINKLAEWKNK